MKKIIFQLRSRGRDGASFLPPWGAWGCLWRTLLFLFALGLLILLLSFFRSCGNGAELPDPQPIDVPADSIVAVPDSIPGADEPLPDNNIDNPGPNLPPPDDNYLPPVSDDQIERDSITGREMVNNRVNVILDSDAGDETFRRWAEEFKQHYPGDEYKVIFYDPLTKLIQIQVPEGSCDRVVRELPQKITDISFRAFREGLLGPLSATPNDPAFRDADASWYFRPIQAFEAWDITQGSEEVVLAVVDSYFDLRHPDLYSSRIVSPFSVKRRNRNVAPEPGLPENNPCFFHGSCVSSMALANLNNGNGAAGIAPKCKYMPVSMGHQFTSMTMVYGILYAIYQGASVINVSAGMNLPPEAAQLPVETQVEMAKNAFKDEENVWEFIFDMAEERGVTIVWAAGNNNILASIDPSKRDATTIRVSALDRRLHKASFSNFGNLPQYHEESSTISAPGVDILGAVPGNRYTLGPGTSYSSPIVAGAVALMKSLDPTLSTTEIIKILQETGKPIEGCTTIGPLLQIKDALLRVKQKQVKADDLFRDHSKFIGKWQTTAKLKVVNAFTGAWTGEYMYIFFDITSENAGRIHYYIKERSEPCGTAPVAVSWSSSSMAVDHTQRAGTFVPARYEFRKASDGRLEFSLSNGEKYYVKRVDRMPC